MSLTTNLIFILIVLDIIFFSLFWFFYQKSKRLQSNVSDLAHSKKSKEVIHGKTWEQFVPFTSNFPYTKENFKFLGDPIDGIVFEEDKIAIVEIKTGSSQLSPKQKKIKELISEGKVEFKELRY